MELRFLYVGSADTTSDLAAWLAVPGAELRWRFRHFGADVAAVDIGAPPLVVLADHRPAGSVLPIYAVADVAASVEALSRGGWRVVTRSAGTPEGPVAVVSDRSGTEIALLRVDRPDAMDAAFADPSNVHAVRTDEASEPAG